MGAIIEATVPAEQFALRDTFRAVPDAEFEVVRIVAHGADGVMPFVWASGASFEDVDDALRADASVAGAEALTEVDDEYLYRMEWTADIRVLMYILLEEQATVLSAHGQDRQWHLRIMLPGRDSLSSTREFCEEFGVDIDIRSIYDLSRSMRRGEFGLSEEQYAALEATLDRGFYAIPRDVTLQDLADELDISHQALSERLRRAHRTLVEQALTTGSVPEVKP